MRRTVLRGTGGPGGDGFSATESTNDALRETAGAWVASGVKLRLTTNACTVVAGTNSCAHAGVCL